MKLVMIDWIDSHTNSRWQDVDNAKAGCTPMRCQSVGWLLVRKEGHTTIAGSTALMSDWHKPDVDRILTIPDVAIKRLRVIGQPGKSKGRATARKRRSK